MSEPPSNRTPTQPANFTITGEYLDRVRGDSDREPLDFVVAILRDLHHGELPDVLDPDPRPFFRSAIVDTENRYGRTLQSLEWFEDADIDLQFMFGGGLPGSHSPLDVEFDLVWLNLNVATDHTIRVAPSSMRGLRSEMITTLYDENPTVDRGTLEERCVLLVTVDGPAYTTPELTVLGPSKRTNGADASESSYAVNIVHFPFDDLSDGRTRADDFTDRLNSQLAALAMGGEEWKEAFAHSVATTSEARNAFRRKLRRELQKTMALFEETLEPADDDQLHRLRQAASLLAYRTMFLQVVERRGRLYRGKVSPASLGDRQITRSLADELAYRTAPLPDQGEAAKQNEVGGGTASSTVPGALLARLVREVRVIRGDIEDDAVAITGASIFDNRPENFDPAIGQWLDAVEDLVDSGDDPGLLRQWDERIKNLGAVMLGHLDDEYRAEVNLIGQGAHRHRHRVLGNIYEQILSMTPKRGDDGTTLKLVVSENGDDDDRSVLGAHYTPIDLVEEVVRPTLGHLFRQYWDDADGDIDAYRRRIREMTVVDPAMGSAHFLTVAALEIARELAWLEFHDKPRFEILEDWDEPLLHENSIGRDPQDEVGEDTQNPLPDEGEVAEQSEVGEGSKEPLPRRGGSGRPQEGRRGDSNNQKTKEHRFHPPEQHNAFQTTVRDYLPDVIQRSIYGVDVNPLATELGKLSLWLFEVGETDDGDGPAEYPELTYLNANIRCGDSVVGVFLDDVEETVENALRSKNSFGGRQETMLGMMSHTETVRDKLDRAHSYRKALTEAPDSLSSFERGMLDESLRHHLDLDGVTSGYELHRRIDHALREHLDELAWLFDLTLAIRYLGYTSGSGAKRAGRLYRALFAELPPGNSTSDVKPPIENALRTLFENPDGDDALDHRTNLTEWLRSQPDLDPFHWELEYPGIFERDGFDAVVTNPPFIGDRDLRGRLGSIALVEFLANYFIPQQRKSDYSGFFFWRYHQIANDRAAVGSLASNSLGQATNRKYVMKPLTTGKAPHFHIFRTVPTRNWPGEAGVHFAAVCAARQPGFNVRIVRPDRTTHSDRSLPVRLKHEHGISSYLDEYPDFDLQKRVSEGNLVSQGCILRGDFSIHRQPGQKVADAVANIPETERDALAAYINSRAIQQRPRPTPSNVVIDFLEPIIHAGLRTASATDQLAWLETHYTTLLQQLRERSPHTPEKPSVKETRSETDDGRGHDEYWWLFGYGRVGLRAAWQNVESVVAFPAVTKIWNPFYLPKHMEIDPSGPALRICPMHNLYVAPSFGLEHTAVILSSLFEMLVRRQCSSFRTGLRFTPTAVFPYFSWPWKAKVDGHRLTIGEPPPYMKQSLESAADDLLELRTDILENPTDHSLTRDLVGGPTDLYNLYDSDPNGENPRPGADAPAVEKLRQAHVDLLDAVLRAYGWDDIADDTRREHWTFDRPWLDRTQRFVPPEPVRAELFARIDQLNTERFELERDLMVNVIAKHLPDDGLTKTGFSKTEPFTDMPIDKDQFEEFMEWEVESGASARVRKKGSRWYGT